MIGFITRLCYEAASPPTTCTRMATALARAGNTSCARVLGPLHQFSDGDRRGAVRASGVLRLLGGCVCGREGGGRQPTRAQALEANMDMMTEPV